MLLTRLAMAAAHRLHILGETVNFSRQFSTFGNAFLTTDQVWPPGESIHLKSV